MSPSRHHEHVSHSARPSTVDPPYPGAAATCATSATAAISPWLLDATGNLTEPLTLPSCVLIICGSSTLVSRRGCAPRAFPVGSALQLHWQNCNGSHLSDHQNGG